jgi:hypothetical protein
MESQEVGSRTGATQALQCGGGDRESGVVLITPQYHVIINRLKRLNGGLCRPKFGTASVNGEECLNISIRLQPYIYPSTIGRPA